MIPEYDFDAESILDEWSYRRHIITIPSDKRNSVILYFGNRIRIPHHCCDDTCVNLLLLVCNVSIFHYNLESSSLCGSP